MNIKLVGSYIKHLTVELMPREEFYAEKGALIYIEDGLEMNNRLSGNTLGKLIGSAISGEKLLIMRFANPTARALRLGIGCHGSLLPIKLEDETVFCKRGSFVASSAMVDISSRFSVAGLMGGAGAMFQTIQGRATVFLSCVGEPVTIDLAYGQTIQVDEDHFLASTGVSQDRINARWSARSFFGGEGFSMLAFTGPGRVYLNP